MELQKQLIEHKALDLLDTYSGANNHILHMKTKKETNKKFYPTRTQAEYVVTYFETKPKVARKWVELDPYFAKKFAQERHLLETPEKIYIEKLLVEKDKSYHIWGKFFEKDGLDFQAPGRWPRQPLFPPSPRGSLFPSRDSFQHNSAEADN